MKAASAVVVWNTERRPMTVPVFLAIAAHGEDALPFDATVTRSHISRTTGGQTADRSPVIACARLMDLFVPYAARPVRIPAGCVVLVRGIRACVRLVDEVRIHAPGRVMWCPPGTPSSDQLTALVPKRLTVVTALPASAHPTDAAAAPVAPPSSSCGNCMKLSRLLDAADAKEDRLRIRAESALRAKAAELQKVKDDAERKRQVDVEAAKEAGKSEGTREATSATATHVSDLRTTIGTLTTDKAKLTADKEKLEQTVGALEDDKKKLEQTIAALRQALQAEKTRSGNLARRLDMISETEVIRKHAEARRLAATGTPDGSLAVAPRAASPGPRVGGGFAATMLDRDRSADGDVSTTLGALGLTGGSMT